MTVSHVTAYNSMPSKFITNCNKLYILIPTYIPYFASRNRIFLYLFLSRMISQMFDSDELKTFYHDFVHIFIRMFEEENLKTNLDGNIILKNLFKIQIMVIL